MARILHMIPGLTGGGAERQLTLLSAMQAARGHDVHLAIMRPEVPASLAGTGVHVHALASDGHHDPRMFLRVRALIRRIRADLVQTWLTLPDVVGGAAALATGRPWILSERAAAAAYPRTWKNRLRERLAAQASAIVANSQGGVKYWLSEGIPRQRVTEVANAIDIATIETGPGPLLPPQCEGRPLVLFVGRLSREKRPLVLVDALAAALPECNAAALLCGEGPLREEVSAAIRAHNAGDRIVLGGYRPDVYPLLRTAQACVAISEFEGSPNVALEAMAAGCPLIVSDIEAYRQMIDRTTATVVPVDDAHATARAIVETLTNRPAAMERAARARERAQAFTPAAMADAYDAVYGRLA